jgi:6-phosphogluconolactonase
MDAANNKVVEVFDTEEDCQCLLRNTQQVYRTSLTKERGSFTVVLSGVSLVKSLRYLVFVTVKFDPF